MIKNSFIRFLFYWLFTPFAFISLIKLKVKKQPLSFTKGDKIALSLGTIGTLFWLWVFVLAATLDPDELEHNKTVVVQEEKPIAPIVEDVKQEPSQADNISTDNAQQLASLYADKFNSTWQQLNYDTEYNIEKPLVNIDWSDSEGISYKVLNQDKNEITLVFTVEGDGHSVDLTFWKSTTSQSSLASDLVNPMIYTALKTENPLLTKARFDEILAKSKSKRYEDDHYSYLFTDGSNGRLLSINFILIKTN